SSFSVEVGSRCTSTFRFGHGHVWVTLRTACSHYERPIAQICKLPVSSESDALENEAP
ncbi:hypothetical protein HN011_003068, partial [Eciton burchellii]